MLKIPVKSMCLTSSQTAYVKNPDLVLVKYSSQRERTGWLPSEIYLNLLSKSTIRGWLKCEIDLNVKVYTNSIILISENVLSWTVLLHQKVNWDDLEVGIVKSLHEALKFR